MKKKIVYDPGGKTMSRLKKNLLKMKLTLFCFLIGVIQLWASQGFSQSTRLTLNLKDTKVENVLNKIEEQSNLYFIYNRKVVDVNRTVNVVCTDQIITEILDKIFLGTNVKYEIQDRHIILMNGEERTGQKTINVSGRISDSTGAPLPGVTIVLKGTTIGTLSDSDGNYSMPKVPSDGALIFSFVGMKSREVLIENKEIINVKLEEETIGIEEVVAIGYGSVKKSDLTGSVSGVSANDIKNQPVSRLETAMQGRVAGVSINRMSGTPGGDIKIRIRGVNSISGGTDPLVVVDGFVGGDLNTLNPNDIENIDILKDASATAIYGSRGANGVIIVTTKKAKIGKPSVNVHAYTGISSVSKKLDLVNAGEWVELYNKQDDALGRPRVFTDEQVQEYYTNGGTDWQNEIFRTGISQNYDASMSGGSDVFNYFVSGNYVGESGILINTNYKRYGIRANIEARPSEKITFGLNIFGTHEDKHNVNNDGAGAVLAAGAFSPIFPVYDETTGDYSADIAKLATNSDNPVFQAREKNDDLNNNVINALGFIKFELNKYLSFSVNGGVQMVNAQRFIFNRHSPASDIGSANATVNDTYKLWWQNYYNLTYSRNIGSHSITATGIYEQSVASLKVISGYALGFSSVSLGYKDLSLASIPSLDTDFGKSALQSFLGRFNYGYKNKYLLTTTFRADGSSKFAEGNKYSYFPSVALAWRLMEEDFIKELGIFDNLKLRLSWGKIGNQAIKDFATMQTLSSSYSHTVDGSSVSSGLGPADLANPNLKWETTNQQNAGVDMGFFENRLGLSLDVYKKTTHDLLVEVGIPYYVGYKSVLTNIGEVENKGFEFNINSTIVKRSNFNWNTSFNFSRNKNTVMEIGDPNVKDEQILLGTRLIEDRAIKEGYPLGAFYGLKYIGIWQVGEEEEAAKFGNKPGDARYEDTNGNGIKDDLQIIGDAQPDFMCGFNNEFNYKNFTLSMLIEGVFGHEKINRARFMTIGGGPAIFSPTNREVLTNQWSPENPNGTVPAFSSSNTNEWTSSMFMEDASFIRCRNITLNYDFGKESLPKMIKSLQLYCSASNLFTITKYKGLDPESQTSGSDTDINSGADEGSIPIARTVTIGIKFGL